MAGQTLCVAEKRDAKWNRCGGWDVGRDWRWQTMRCGGH